MVAADNASRLEQILDYTRAVVALRKSQADRSALELAAAAHKPRGFVRALREKSAEGPAVIAEIKKASPSKGLIRENFGARDLAVELEAAGAACLSVLTEEKWFLGSLWNLRAASEATRLPCLRKDFMLDEFQILEARANGADAILLIAAALEDDTLVQLAQAARRLDLDVLCEVHTAEELDRVLALDLDAAHIAIGINSRNLHTFDVSLDDAAALAKRFTACRSIADRSSGERPLLVAESGIATGADIATLRDCGYSAFLIGETLMRAASPGKLLQTLLQMPPCG